MFIDLYKRFKNKGGNYFEKIFISKKIKNKKIDR